MPHSELLTSKKGNPKSKPHHKDMIEFNLIFAIIHGMVVTCHASSYLKVQNLRDC